MADNTCQIETLTLNESRPINQSVAVRQVKSRCFVCEEEFEDVEVKKNKDLMLTHAMKVHKLVIADVQLIPYFHRYVAHWRERFSEKSMEDYCWGIKTNPKTGTAFTGAPESFYLLCDMLPEDKELRHNLQRQKLNDVLEQHQVEKEDTTTPLTCLFCPQTFAGSRYKFFHHMTHDHNFHIGRPENLVFTDELLQKLREQLNRNICLFCEKDFKDRATLKEHMRKKVHKRVNPENKQYDKYYLVNYLEMGKNWTTLQTEEDTEADTSINDDWSDWHELPEGQDVVCLFCDERSDDTASILKHMTVVHAFDLEKLKTTYNFYERVQLINYVRDQMHHKRCMNCGTQYKETSTLLKHMTSAGHTSTVPEKRVWNQPHYYIPLYEDDLLLCALEDDENEADIVSSPNVTAQDLPRVSKESVLNDPSTVEELKA